MLKLMNDNDNINGGINSTPTDPGSLQPAPFDQVSNSSQSISQPAPQLVTGVQPPSSHEPSHTKKSSIKNILLFILVVVLFGASSYGAYYFGKKTKKEVAVVATPQPIDLPAEAIVTTECAPGRGKQYIIPKDIPVGPVYDVRNSEVIAIEYVIGVKDLILNSDNFSSTLLLLTKNYPVDHFSIIPQQPKAGDTDQFINLIMYVVSKAEAAKITCTDATAGGTTTPASTPTNTTTTQ